MSSVPSSLNQSSQKDQISREEFTYEELQDLIGIERTTPSKKSRRQPKVVKNVDEIFKLLEI